jgi:hypothetical protein
MLPFTHLFGYQRVNLGAVIFVIGQAFVDLCSCHAGKTAAYIVHGCSGDNQPHNIMYSDARAFNDHSAPPHARFPSKVTVSSRSHT